MSADFFDNEIYYIGNKENKQKTIKAIFKLNKKNGEE